MSKWILVGLLAFAVALTGTAYAEVQNVKVSGDIDVKVISHHDYDLRRSQKNAATGFTDSADTDQDNAELILSTVRLGVNADLTDNVQASVRLLNQRFWDTDVDATNNIDIDNAYLVLKEFLYSPLTVIIGRQDLKYGNGFIVGAGLLGDPNGMFAGAAVDVNGIDDVAGTVATDQSQIAQEHSAYNAYDAVRLILDFAPITVEGLFAQINETATLQTNDQYLFGALLNYKLDRWNAEVEPYWFFKDEGARTTALTVSDAQIHNAPRTYERNQVHTFGMRLGASPLENLKLSGEGAVQTGELVDTTLLQKRDKEGWAATLEGRYSWAHVPWTPTTGLGWVYYSGEEPRSTAENGDQSDHFNAWDSMYRGSFTTYIQDFFAGNDGGGLYVTRDPNDTSATTNRQLAYFDVGAKPLEDLNLWARYTHAWFARQPRIGRSKVAGDEVDVKATYDYTEDVQFALAGGFFIPGRYYEQAAPNDKGNDLAWTLVSSASVKF